MATTDQFRVKEFLAWLRTKPRSQPYDFTNPRACAVAQFGRAKGIDLDNLKAGALARLGVLDAVNPAFGRHTFGALADRLDVQINGSRLSRAWTKVDAYFRAAVQA